MYHTDMLSWMVPVLAADGTFRVRPACAPKPVSWTPRRMSLTASPTARGNTRSHLGLMASTVCPNRSRMEDTGCGSQYLPRAGKVAYAAARESGFVLETPSVNGPTSSRCAPLVSTWIPIDLASLAA